MKTLAQRMDEIGMSLDQLVTASGFDKRLAKAVVSGNFTPTPAQRQRLANVLGVSTDDISWEHAVSVQHIRGSGSQRGRST